MKVVLLIILEIAIGTYILEAQSEPIPEPSQEAKQQMMSPLMMFGDALGERKDDFNNNESGVRSRADATDVAAGDDHQNQVTSSFSQITPADIYERGYLKIDADEFQRIAPPTAFLKISAQYTELVSTLRKYGQLQDDEAKEAALENLELLTKNYLAAKMQRFSQELLYPELNSEKINRIRRRIEVCNLLLKGIEIEHFHLMGFQAAHCSADGKLTLRKGTRFELNGLIDYKENFASGSSHQ